MWGRSIPTRNAAHWQVAADYAASNVDAPQVCVRGSFYVYPFPKL
jgi:hypothetical protein